MRMHLKSSYLKKKGKKQSKIIRISKLIKNRSLPLRNYFFNTWKMARLLTWALTIVWCYNDTQSKCNLIGSISHQMDTGYLVKIIFNCWFYHLFFIFRLSTVKCFVLSIFLFGWKCILTQRILKPIYYRVVQNK